MLQLINYHKSTNGDFNVKEIICFIRKMLRFVIICMDIIEEFKATEKPLLCMSHGLVGVRNNR